GTDGVTGFNLVSFLVALGGAILLIAIYKMFTRRSIN
ncbi:GlsB/YeaQ/YmgE family stress response membrane protein, partial [Propionibacterium freudenreichii]